MKSAESSSHLLPCVPARGRPGENAGHHHHSVQFYESDEFLIDSVAAYLSAGLAAGEAVILIATPERRQALAQRLTQDGFDLPAWQARGCYIAIDAAETLTRFIVDDGVDTARFRELVSELVGRAAQGRCGLRAFGEMVALLWAEGNGAAAIQLEEVWNEVTRQHGMSLFCAYPIHGFDDAEDAPQFTRICQAHSRVLPSENYSALHSDEERLRAVASLQQKAHSLEAETSRRAAAEAERSVMQELPAQNPAPVICLSREHIVSYANPAAQAFLAEWNCSTGMPAPPAIAVLANNGLCHPGEITFKDRSYHVAIVPLAGGAFTNLYFTDITERKGAEDALAQSQRDLAEQVEDLEQLHRCTQRLVGIRDLNALLEEVLHAATAVHRTHQGLLSFVDPETRMLQVGVSTGFTAEFLDRIRRVPIGSGACGTCFEQKERVIVEDVETDPLFASFRETARIGGFRSVYSTPLMVRGDEMIGVLSVHFARPQRPTARAMRLMELYARQAADAIENTRLRNEAEQQLAERRRAEEKVRHLASIVESSDDAIISTDLNGVIVSWNKGAQILFGYSADEVVGKPVTILLPPDRANEEASILERIRHGQKIDHYETVRLRKDGTRLDISLTVSPIKDANGRVIGASKVARDIGDRVRAKEKLEQIVAERTAQLRDTVAELEAFSYSVAHDMRAPLRAMNGYARFVEEDFGHILPPEGKDFLDRIAAGAGRLDALITDVLNYSKISRGELTLGRVDLETLIREIIDSYPELQSSGATILVQSPIPAVIGNAAALTQCISNLLSNAVKFVVPGVAPQVRVYAEKKGDCIRLSVADNGIGISEEGQKRIFRMFQRLNPATAFEGTGIGLTIVRKATERMGGRVGLESQPGAGSCFWIELKRAA